MESIPSPYYPYYTLFPANKKGRLARLWAPYEDIEVFGFNILHSQTAFKMRGRKTTLPSPRKCTNLADVQNSSRLLTSLQQVHLESLGERASCDAIEIDA